MEKKINLNQNNKKATITIRLNKNFNGNYRNKVNLNQKPTPTTITKRKQLKTIQNNDDLYEDELYDENYDDTEDELDNPNDETNDPLEQAKDKIKEKAEEKLKEKAKEKLKEKAEEKLKEKAEEKLKAEAKKQVKKQVEEKVVETAGEAAGEAAAGGAAAGGGTVLGIILLILLILVIIIIIIVLIIQERKANSGSNYATTCESVTVTGESAGVYALEDYIAGVITHEAYSTGGAEALKAQAIAARTYLLKKTNDCTKSIENSTSAQTFDPNPEQWAKDAALATSGMVLTYNGDIFLSEYDSFCHADSDCPSATCNSEECTVEYTKQPNKEKHTITLKTKQWINVIRNGEGHSNGMSQLVSYEMAANGSTYEEILKFFYSDGVEISNMSSGETGEGLEEINGFQARTSRATRDNKYFYGDGANNEGECAWYAVRRTNEILGTLGKDIRVSTGGNGGDFCTAPDYDSFKKTKNVDEIQPGDVVSMSGGCGHRYGHVYIIEKVYRDSNGKLTSALVSEGGLGFGSGINTYYENVKITKNYIWNLNAGPWKREVRKHACEAGYGSGCQHFGKKTRAQIEKPGCYKFECAIHLLG